MRTVEVMVGGVIFEMGVFVRTLIFLCMMLLRFGLVVSIGHLVGRI